VEKFGKLFVFSAPSGSGKTTIVKNTLKQFPELIFSISSTTRERRANEVDGRDYFFISEDEFKKKIGDDEFVEWEIFYDYYYGTSKSFVDDNRKNGKSVVFEVDVKGAVSIKKTYPDAILIFIKPPSLEELKERLVKRNTETAVDLKKRFERAEMELGYEKYFDYVIENKNLEKAKEKAINIIESELYKEINNGSSSN
jgi:guanylate kinase